MLLSLRLDFDRLSRDDENVGLEPLGAARVTTERPASIAVQRPSDLSPEAARGILMELGAVLARAKLDGKTVRDVSLLPHPQDDVGESALLLYLGQDDQEANSGRRAALRVLPFFQPGVGEHALSLDGMAPDGRTWREIVETEMKEDVKRVQALGR